MTKPITRLLVIVTLLLAFGLASAAEGPKGDQKRLNKTLDLKSWKCFTINKLFNVYQGDGVGSLSPIADNGAMEYPKGSGKTVNYEDGFLVGGYRLGRLFMDGSTYGSGMVPGRITQNGTGVDKADAVAENAEAPSVRMYRVRPDVNPYTIDRAAALKIIESQELPLTNRYVHQTADEMYDEYKKDWDEWPVASGAPYNDVNADGKYDPTVDIPGIPNADQTMWHVYNDTNEQTCFNFYAGYPIGLEIQRTIWGYNRQSALGNIIFLRYKVFNKSGVKLDSTYMTMWADIDLGDATDDLAGCDTLLSMGYVYNAKPDASFGTATPATGYVFFSGPTIPGAATDSAVVDLKRVYGKKNLKMSSFNIFILGGPSDFADPSLASKNPLTGAVRWYNLMKGLVGVTGLPWKDASGKATNWVTPGDPVTNTGWVDGVYPYGPRDRRICLTTGPFTTQKDEVQECVVAALVGQGADRLSSVTKMRQVARDAQDTYDNLFQVVTPPPPPLVLKSELDGAVILNWGDPKRVSETENYASRGYAFQGYRLYQLKGNSPSDADKQLAEYNVGAIQRQIKITNDELKGGKLVNGNVYYFGVSAFSKNPTPKEGEPETISGTPAVSLVVPQALAFGLSYNVKYLDTVKTTKVGAADGNAVVRVINPTLPENGNYSIEFNKANTFTLKTPSGSTEYPFPSGPVIAKGLEISFEGLTWDAPLDPTGSVATKVSGSTLAFWGTATLFGYGSGMYQDFFGGTRSIPATKSQWDLEMRFTGVPKDAANPNESEIVSGGQWMTLWPAGARSLANVSAYTGRNVRGPFELWDVENNKQINYCDIDRNYDAKSPWGNTNATFTAYAGNPWLRFAGRAYIIVNYSDYDAAGLQAGTKKILPEDANATWLLVPVATSKWGTGDKLRINFNNPLVEGLNKVNFAVDASAVSTETEKEQVKKINVYPNPYLAFNKQEGDRYSRFVTFNHLPEKATLRIFTVTGQLVKTIVKDSKSQFTVWNLLNETSLPVASGIYVVYVDMPSLGVTKTLKLAIIQPVQILDRRIN
ncbi:MAG: T9SS type A sorting domain-containing protein [bacterium]